MVKKLSGYLKGEADNLLATTPTHTRQASGPYDEGKAVAGMFMSYNTSEYMDDTDGDGQVTHVMQYDNKMPPGMTPLDENQSGDDLMGTNVKKISSPVFSSNDLKTHQATDTDGAIKFRARGTYNGAPGEYRCTAVPCTSRAAVGGGIELGGTWIFDPDAGAMVDDPDSKYATFGWWLNEERPDADKVGTFHVVSDAGTIDLTSVTGTATYNGIAVGKAALNAARGDDNIGGAFTANASLTATFDGASNSMLEGEITKFMIGGESPNWTVKLNKATLAAGGIGADAGANTTWSIEGVDSNESGGWQAKMYDQGPVVGGDNGSERPQPTGVTGGFNSQFGVDGHMVGAFGAEK